VTAESESRIEGEGRTTASLEATPRKRLVRETRAAFSIARARLRQTRMGRFARGASYGLAALALIWVITLRISDGSSAPLLGVPVRVAKLAFWLGAVPVALASATGFRLKDRAEGVEALLFTQGLGSRALDRARVVAAGFHGVLAISIPAAVAAIGSLAAAPTLRAAKERLLVTIAVMLYGVVAGGIVGSVGAIADWLMPRRGRSALITVAFASWALADFVHDPRLSVTGIFSIGLRLLLRAFGIGGIG
jgi:hypothetical protein